MSDNENTHRLARHAVLLSTIVVLAGLTFAPSWAPTADARTRPTASATGHVFATTKPECAIGNFAEIEPGLARGARLTDEGIEYLRANGYKTVVAFWTGGQEKERLEKAGIELVSIPIHSNAFGSDVPTPDQVRTFLAATADSSKRPLYFHCYAGKDRTGAMAAVYRMERQGWKNTDAAEEMKAFGFHGHYRNLYRFVTGYACASGTASATPSEPAAASIEAASK